ncbi:MAG: hypothetical protein KC940_17415, partial [Candidatus Omnitrophica bacterium]|nr:hypothetical protein [Candidatus Omnitrophota bacterium]
GTEVVSADPTYQMYGPDNSVETYSPTNGSKSKGDIFLWGGDPFWIGVAIGNLSARKSYSPAMDVGLVVDMQPYLHKLPPPLK